MRTFSLLLIEHVYVSWNTVFPRQRERGREKKKVDAKLRIAPLFACGRLESELWGAFPPLDVLKEHGRSSIESICSFRRLFITKLWGIITESILIYLCFVVSKLSAVYCLYLMSSSSLIEFRTEYKCGGYVNYNKLYRKRYEGSEQLNSFKKLNTPSVTIYIKLIRTKIIGKNISDIFHFL